MYRFAYKWKVYTHTHTFLYIFIHTQSHSHARTHTVMLNKQIWMRGSTWPINWVLHTWGAEKFWTQPTSQNLIKWPHITPFLRRFFIFIFCWEENLMHKISFCYQIRKAGFPTPQFKLFFFFFSYTIPNLQGDADKFIVKRKKRRRKRFWEVG